MRTMLRAVALAGAVALVAGCAESTLPGVGVPSEPSSVVKTVTGVNFYPACGNETVEVDGTMYYQLLPDEQDGLPTPAVTAVAGAMGYSRGVPMVPAPGPGDDVGNMVIYDNGFAFFRSDSGELDTWLTTEEREYNWVC